MLGLPVMPFTDQSGGGNSTPIPQSIAGHSNVAGNHANTPSGATQILAMEGSRDPSNASFSMNLPPTAPSPVASRNRPAAPKRTLRLHPHFRGGSPTNSELLMSHSPASSSPRGIKFVLPPPSSPPQRQRRPRPFKYNEAFDYSYFTRVCGLEGTTEGPPATLHVPYLGPPVAVPPRGNTRSDESSQATQRSGSTTPSTRCERPMTLAEVQYLRRFFGPT
jgi:hypothetical protein